MDLNRRDRLARLRLHTQADVQQMWELLMEPLGFGSVSIWVCPVDDRGAPTPHLVQLCDDDLRLPSRVEVDAFVDCMARLLREEPDLVGLAFLISRPGRHGITAGDRAVAARLLSRCRADGIACEPVHVADDLAVHVIAPDDLAV